MRDRKRFDPDGRGGGEEPGGLKEKKTIIRIYFVREKSVSNKMKTNKQFSPMKSPCGYKSLLGPGPCPAIDRQHKMNSMTILEVICHTRLSRLLLLLLLFYLAHPFLYYDFWFLFF